MNNKAHLRPQDYDSNGDIIPMACKEEKSDLISRKWLTDAIRNRRTYLSYEDAKDVIDLIDNAPTVPNEYMRGYEAAEREYKRPQGEWIKVTKAGTVPVEYICSLCRRKIYDNYELTTPIDEFYPFCHCGADMRKGGAENDL